MVIKKPIISSLDDDCTALTTPREHSTDLHEGSLGSRGRDVRKYAQQIWLAGLGAFSRADGEGGLFDSLVKIGEDLEHRAYDLADTTVEAVEGVKERVQGTYERIERALDETVHQTASRIGLASNRELGHMFELLSEHLEHMNRRLDQIEAHLNQQAIKRPS